MTQRKITTRGWWILFLTLPIIIPLLLLMWAGSLSEGLLLMLDEQLVK